MKPARKILNQLSQLIFDKKGFNILALDVSAICSMTDYFLIAEGSVDRHVKALSTLIKNLLAETEFHPIHVEGEREGEWIVIDCSEFVVHLFIPEMREKYALEELWNKGKIVDLQIKTENRLLE